MLEEVGCGRLPVHLAGGGRERQTRTGKFVYKLAAVLWVVQFSTNNLPQMSLNSLAPLMFQEGIPKYTWAFFLGRV